MRVFVSYSHAQGEWVWNRLVPCLRAGGTEVLIDRERFEAGGAVVRQMDAVQDTAAKHVLVLSSEYLNSANCRHEMDRAIAADPGFARHIVVPVRRDDAALPASIKTPDPLYVDLRDDGKADQWALLLNGCGADLGTTAPHWLAARDAVAAALARHKSINLVVTGGAAWRGLINEVSSQPGLAIGLVDLEHPATIPRRGLVAAILGAGGKHELPVPRAPDDLNELQRVLAARGRSLVALVHFDAVRDRPTYKADLFLALRYLVMETRTLVLLIQSRAPFTTLLPHGHPLSEILMELIELKSHP